MRHRLRLILTPALPLLLVVAVIALHAVWTTGADGPHADAPAEAAQHDPDETQRVLQEAIEAAPAFKQPIVLTLPKRIKDDGSMNDYPASEPMLQWTTRTSDFSRGENELIIELTPAGRAELLPYLEETETEYRIAIAKREI